MANEWQPIRLPKELYDEITKVLTDKKLWINETDFVRDAVREKIAKVKEVDC